MYGSRGRRQDLGGPVVSLPVLPGTKIAGTKIAIRGPEPPFFTQDTDMYTACVSYMEGCVYVRRGDQYTAYAQHIYVYSICTAHICIQQDALLATQQ